MSTDKNLDYMLDNSQQKDKTWVLYLGICISSARLFEAKYLNCRTEEVKVGKTMRLCQLCKRI